MPTSPIKPGYSDAARTAVRETALRVEEMHGAISDLTFSLLQRIPLLSIPVRQIRGLHDAISSGAYRAIHHGNDGLFGAAAKLERTGKALENEHPPGRLATGLRSALNGVFGDHLAEHGNSLAIEMGFFQNGRALTLQPEALRAAFPDAGHRICCFIHGLACDEFCWDPAGTRDDMGEASGKRAAFGPRIEAEAGWMPLYLRYNTGLPIAGNAAMLAALLERLHTAWPHPGCEIVLIGHSMGGLVALGACEAALAGAMRWPGAVRMVVCLGSPQLGSPLERLGHLTHAALHLNPITEPLGRIAAARSQGIRDLRTGPGVAGEATCASGIPLRFLGASLTADVDHPLGKLIGDGLVPLPSAIAHFPGANVASACLGGIGHMALLNDARVYRQISDWLAEIEP